MMIKALGKWCMHKRFEEKFSGTLKTLTLRECGRFSVKMSEEINFSKRRICFRVLMEIASSEVMYSCLS